MKKLSFLPSALLAALLIFCSCNHVEQSKNVAENETTASEAPEYFNLRPKLEKEYGYTHAVRIGDDLKISGAVSMNDPGMIVAPGDMAQQMKTVTATWKRSYITTVIPMMMW